ncbi:MAG: hypothetical protein KAJ57_03000, partial [Woeseiaceae bacterium]|nr:hypothetical protein [Woeseiaceae bacterium]
CPARAGQSNVTFEMFREGHVPECQSLEELPDVFNDPTGLDDEVAVDEESEDQKVEDEEQEESLF